MSPSLPTEVFLEIFDHFTQPLDSAIHEAVVSRRSLASLCRVSRRFRDLATPLLYQQVRIFDDDIAGFTRAILRNLTSRQLVTSLSFEFALAGSIDPAEADPDRRRKVTGPPWDYARCLQAVLDLLGPHRPGDGTSIGRGGAGIMVLDPPDDMFEDHTSHPEDLAAILLFVLPKLNTLRIKLDPMCDHENPGSEGYWRCEMLLQALRLPAFIQIRFPGTLTDSDQLEIPASLSSLQKLIVCDPFEEPGTIKVSYPPIQYCDFQDMAAFWCLPSLRSLTLERIEGSAHPMSMTIFMDETRTLSSTVEELHIEDGNMDFEILAKALRQFPRLRVMTYRLSSMFSVVGPDWMHVPPESLNAAAFIRALQPCASTLRSIEFQGIENDFDYWTNYIIDFEDDAGSEESQSDTGAEVLSDENELTRLDKMLDTVDLRPFPRLEHVAMHITNFVGWAREWQHCPRPKSPPLAHVLPPTIRELTLSYDHVLEPEILGHPSPPPSLQFLPIETLILDAGQPYTTGDGQPGARRLPCLEAIRLVIPGEWSAYMRQRLGELEALAAGRGIKLEAMLER
ncbi:hypothetical protein F4778DRAFT_91437 [Xylariomycetidae sp. FL2044]|nr:hypothetical protein F4778DRAFT_91437 [Xylariomycetidae sp. FL2044]